jgi:hypothetical protein
MDKKMFNARSPFKSVIANAVRRAVTHIAWERDPFVEIKTEPVKDKPLETLITARMSRISYKFIVQVREIK